MNDFDPVEILLAEDSETDAEMTIRALQGKNLTNRLVRVKDGAEALDFIFRRGAYAAASGGLAQAPAARSQDAEGRRHRGVAARSRLERGNETMPVVS
jgi:hypothetical protein